MQVSQLFLFEQHVCTLRSTYLFHKRLHDRWYVCVRIFFCQPVSRGVCDDVNGNVTRQTPVTEQSNFEVASFGIPGCAMPGRKRCHVRLNAPVQEPEHNIMQYMNSPVMVDAVLVQYERHSSMAERQWHFQRQR